MRRFFAYKADVSIKRCVQRKGYQVGIGVHQISEHKACCNVVGNQGADVGKLFGQFITATFCQGKANPLATVWSASQMLDFFGHEEWGKKLIDCIEEVLTDKKVLTPDLGGSTSTEEVGNEILKKILEKD